MVFSITPAGELEYIHDDELAALESAGRATARRASHVEPRSESGAPGVVFWSADMAPVGGPELGPFKSRTEALSAERSWLEEHYL